MPIASRAPPKAMWGKCERGHSFLTPGLQFHGVDRADVYYNICVRAIRCGKCALNPPTSQPLPRRRPSPAPAQRHAAPSTSAPPRSADARPPTARCTPSPSTSAPPRSPDAHPLAARCIPRRPHNPFPADLTIRSPPKTFAQPRTTTRSPSVPLRAQKTAPHSACAMPNVSVDRRAVGHLGW